MIFVYILYLKMIADYMLKSTFCLFNRLNLIVMGIFVMSAVIANTEKNEPSTVPTVPAQSKAVVEVKPLDTAQILEKRVIVVDDTKTEIIDFNILTGETKVIVHLKIGKLSLKDGKILGRYEIIVDMDNIPAAFRILAGSKNEEGEVVLESNVGIDEIMKKGARLVGQGFCEKKKGVRKIICVISPATENRAEGKLGLVIDSGKRLMEFSSHYKVCENVEAVKAQTAVSLAR